MSRRTVPASLLLASLFWLVLVGGPLSAAITSASGGTFNLSAEGSADWVHWGLTSATSVNRKSGVAAQIGPLTAVGAPALQWTNAPASRMTWVWSDGTPTASATTRTFLYHGDAGAGPDPAYIGRGFRFTVAADTSERTLAVYLGGSRSRARISVQLSDGSAPVLSQTVENLSGPYDRRLELTYRAASPGQTLTVEYLQETASGNIILGAATLQASTTVPPNQPPLLAPIGAQTATEGQQLAFTVTATDPGDTVTLSASGLPAGASFRDNGGGSGAFSWTPATGAAAASPNAVTFTATDSLGQQDAETTQITVLQAPPGGGQLSAAITSASGGTFNLSAEGSADWAHWGLTSATSVNRKSGVTAQIGPLTALGAPALQSTNAPASRMTWVWSDGTPTASATTRTFLNQGDTTGKTDNPAYIGRGFRFTVAADTSERTLAVYLGGSRSRARINVQLSDGSAPVLSQTVENLSGP